MSAKASEKAGPSRAVVAAVDIFAGTVAGVAQVAVGHPLDTIKVRLQTQGTGADKKFNGMLDCISKTIKAEGASALYRGAASPLTGAMALNATLFVANGQARQFLTGGVNRPLSLRESFYAGCMAGFAITFVETPFDLFKCKLQAQVGQGQYRGVFHAAEVVLKNHGLTGAYQGFTATLIRDVPMFGAYFWAFDAAKKFLTKEGEEVPLWATFCAGGFSGGFSWIAVYPMEIIKTKLQTDASEKSKRKYSGIIDCAKRVMAEEGLGGFFRGFIPCAVRGVLVNAAIFTAYSVSKKELDKAIGIA